MGRACRWWLVILLVLLAGLPAAYTQAPDEDQGPRLGAPPEFQPPLAAPDPTPLPPPANPLAADVVSTTGRGDMPAITIEKIGPKSINIGRPLVTEVAIKNVGNGPAYDVRVEDEVPARTKFLKADPTPESTANNRLVWSLGKLEPGAERRLKVEIQPLEETELASKATVTFSSAAMAGLRMRVTRPQLVVNKSGPQTATVGDPVPFRIDVSNPGTGPATGVVIRDQLPPGLQHPQGSHIEADIGTLAPGETRTINLKTKAAAPGRHINKVVATGDDGLQATASAVVQVGQPVLKLYKQGPSQRFLNTEAVFVIDAQNTGDAPARQVKLVDALPAGLQFVEASDGGRYEKDSHSVQWYFEAIGPGENRRVSLKVLAVAPGEMRNQAVVKAEPNLDEKADKTLFVIGVPAMLLEVVDRDDPLEVGGETRYEIRVLNQGTALNTNVQVIAVIPDGMVAVGADADVPYRIQGQQVIFDALPRLAAKADAVYRVTVRGDVPGDHRFRVQLKSDQLRIPVAEEESTHVYRD